MHNRQKACFLALFALGAAALFLMICSTSSFLYPINRGVDENCFFTVGRAICAGKIPYVDIYDQKGPLLYFLFALAACISSADFIGVYLLEVVCFALFLFFSAKCASLYLKRDGFLYLIILILAFIIPISTSFTHGGNAEELCLFTIPLSLFYALRAIRARRIISFWEAFWIGVCGAVTLWIKFTFCGFFLGLGLFVLLWYGIEKKPPKDWLHTIGGFFTGMLVLSAVVLSYFLYHHAIADLWNGYFYNNLFLYNATASLSWIKKIYILLNGFITAIRYNLWFSIPLLIGIVWLLKNCKQSWRETLAVLCSFCGLTILTFIGGQSWQYYPLILSPYAVFGLIAVTHGCESVGLSEKIHLKKAAMICGIGGLTAVFMLTAFLNSKNAFLMRYDRDSLPQYRFAKIIVQTEGATLLNYHFLDGGFYFAAETLPINKYFCHLNISDEMLPEVTEEPNRYIEEGLVDFVVTRDTPLEEYDVDSSFYACVDRAEGPDREDHSWTFYLYQKIR